MAQADDKSGCDEDMERRIRLDASYGRDLSTLFKELRSLAVSGIEYYECVTGENNERFHSSFAELYEHLDRGIEPSVDYLVRIAHLYDYDSNKPGSGYRSIIKIIHKCCLHLTLLSRYILLNRDSFLFRGRHYSKELCAYVSTLGQLRACLHYLKLLVHYCEDGVLFPDESTMDKDDYNMAEQLMTEVESLDQEPFYGRCLGFQYCQSMVKPLTTINFVMAAFSEGYGQTSTVMKLASSVIGGSKYLVDPELRAQQVINVTRNGDINFCKAFWQINENSLMHTLPLFVCPPVHLDKVIVLEPDELVLARVDGTGDVKVSPPGDHSCPGSVNTRLISYELHEGQEAWGVGNEALGNRGRTTNMQPKSSGLVVHIHGGGFVAQSSASHEIYLRHWAKQLDVPIFCIDYSLAPEHPFPRQLQEVFYAYCWALKNALLLGSTAERVCVTGDSAGGNLAVAIAMKASALGIRVPDGILSTYGCMLIKYSPSPSRILALMDPLLPIGILSKCLAAYAGLPQPDTQFPFPSSTSSASLSSVTKSASSNQLCENCSKELKGDSPAPNETVKRNDSESKIDGRFISHKQTDSGDSGFQEAFPEVIEPLNEENSFTVGCTEDEDDTVCEQLNTEDMSLSQLVGEIKSGADRVDSDVRNLQNSSAKRHNLKLHLPSNHRGMNKSQSNPFFRTHHHNVASSPKSTQILQDLQALSSNSPLGSPTFAAMRHAAQSPMQQFHLMPIAADPYMSPMLAGDDMLEGICPVYLVACQLDPLLDDSITFARRLRSLQVPVNLDILEDLCHGFLNFVLVSPEAKKGSDVCVARIKEILSVNDLDDFNDLDLGDDSHMENSWNGAS